MSLGAELALEAFEHKWRGKYDEITKSWRRNWDELMAFMDYPEGMRRMIYTTNAVEALHRIVRKLIKGKAAWVSETAMLKQLYLSLMQYEKSWKRQAYGWKGIRRDLGQITVIGSQNISEADKRLPYSQRRHLTAPQRYQESQIGCRYAVKSHSPCPDYETKIVT
jgi:hypothetical protein